MATAALHLVTLLLHGAFPPTQGVPAGAAPATTAAQQAPAEAGAPPEFLLDHAALTREIEALAAAHPERATRILLGRSREGRAIEGLLIAGECESEKRPALLLIAKL
jgi:hypothetical protein